MVKSNMYKRIQKLKRKGLKKSEIAQKLKMDPHTIAKYYDMSKKDFSIYQQTLLNKDKAFDIYKDDIIIVFDKNNGKKVPVSSVFDYLEEKYGTLPANEQTLRNYVKYLKKSNQLSLSSTSRHYKKVDELPYGKQMQLDFGEYTTDSGLKIYIFASVLSASRFKFVSFQDKPFTTQCVIQHLLDCFDFYGGMPEELVIDQDRVMVVSENKGDIIFTKDFSYFIKEMDLKMYVCRKGDPESKGKIENLIKFVKYNFLASRDFKDIDSAKESLFDWLQRRANGKISQATGKIPVYEIEKERQKLREIRNSIYRRSSEIDREERKVDRDSYVSVNSSFYSVPIEYKEKLVEIYQTLEQLFIFDKISGEEIAHHQVSMIPGQKVINNDHFRVKSKNIKIKKEEITNRFDLLEWKSFIQMTFKTYSRYVTDQCREVDKYFDENTDLAILKKALILCLEYKTYSVKNLYDSYCYYRGLEENNEEDVLKSMTHGLKEINRHKKEVRVSKTGLSFYKSLINVLTGVFL
jgi:hypothetical protein